MEQNKWNDDAFNGAGEQAIACIKAAMELEKFSEVEEGQEFSSIDDKTMLLEKVNGYLGIMFNILEINRAKVF